MNNSGGVGEEVGVGIGMVFAADDEVVADGRQGESGRQAVAIDDIVEIRAGFTATNEGWADFLAHFFAGNVDETTLTCDQPVAPTMSSSSSEYGCKEVHTPAVCQSCSCCLQFKLEQPANFDGRNFRGMPLANTNAVLCSAFCAERRGRPPRGRNGLGGINVTIFVGKSLGNGSLAISQTQSNMVYRELCR